MKRMAVIHFLSKTSDTPDNYIREVEIIKKSTIIASSLSTMVSTTQPLTTRLQGIFTSMIYMVRSTKRSGTR